MKKIILVSLFAFSFWVVVPHVFAFDCTDGYTERADGSGCDPITAGTGSTKSSGFTALAPIPGLTDQGDVSSSSSLANFFNNLYKYLIGLAATLAVIEIIWGGLLISTQDSIGNHEEGKERIKGAILGLILVLSPVLVFSIINPSILNLSLNLPELKTIKTAPAQSPVTTSSSSNLPAEPSALSGQWCSHDPGSNKFVCATTKDLCEAARSKNGLLITESCVLTPS